MPSNTVEKVQSTDLKEYKAFFKEIKEKILTSQVKAALAVNHELINLYWEIGSRIHLKQKDGGHRRSLLPFPLTTATEKPFFALLAISRSPIVNKFQSQQSI